MLCCLNFPRIMLCFPQWSLCASIGFSLTATVFAIYTLLLIAYDYPPGPPVQSTVLPPGPIGQAGYSVMLVGECFSNPSYPVILLFYKPPQIVSRSSPSPLPSHCGYIQDLDFKKSHACPLSFEVIILVADISERIQCSGSV
ncbi:hypothetical protein BJ138DRAFT_478067 [Hygrophoropsis aurantiaca]|uniref:Uncharacterized protein n=1 Tax=Hygrophoropsis aurantiaca TaxID=72124 RepID=A0ACB8ALK2_9AGAM|nr:hypothetical protein BJ138DRAFT_478067 [Hygrophoropsis aurantiaca]